MPVLDIHSTILVYGDDGFTPNSNPQRRFMDWTRHTTGMQVEKPSIREYSVQPGEELEVFAGKRDLSYDANTELGIIQNTVKPNTYRLTLDGGFPPLYRGGRNYTGVNTQHTLTVNNNSMMRLDLPFFGAYTFSTNVFVGDFVYIPGAAVGDTYTSPFNPNNQGFWNVVSVSQYSVTLRRPVGESFRGVSEVVTPTDNFAMEFFSPDGVQKGDTLEISAGFSPVSLKSYIISEVAQSWVEFTSTEDLPIERSIKVGATGLNIYSDAKRFIRIETDQEAIIRINGDTGSTVKLSPRIVGDPEAVAHFEIFGTVWDLRIENRSTVNMAATVISAE